MSPGFTSVRDALVRRFPSGSPGSWPSGIFRNLVYLATTGIIGLGVIVGVNVTANPLATVNSFVTTETATGAYQTIAGATVNGSIYTTSGAIIQGRLASPNCEISATGALQNCVWQGAVIAAQYLAAGGLSAAAADARYVKKQGDGMTGALAIRVGSTVPAAKAGLALEVTGIASGSALYGQTISGANLVARSTFQGAGLSADCSTTGQKLLWSGSTKQFACGVDQNSGSAYTTGQGLTNTLKSFSLNTTISGTLLRFRTASASTIYAKTSISDTGSLSVAGAIYFQGIPGCSAIKTDGIGTASCNNALLSTTLADDNALVGNASNVAAATALPSCSNGTSQALEYNTSTNTFSCATMNGTVYSAGQGLTLAGNVFSLNATLTGSTLKKWSLLSGSTLQADAVLASSGTLSIRGKAQFYSAVFDRGTLSGSKLTVDGNVALGGNLNMTGALRARGTLSGASLFGNVLSGALLRARAFSPAPMGIVVVDTGSAVTVGSGKALLTIPSTFSGFSLISATATVMVAGTTNSTILQVVNLDKGNVRMFTTGPTIPTGATVDDGTSVISANSLVSGKNRLRVDISKVSTTAPSVLELLLLFAQL